MQAYSDINYHINNFGNIRYIRISAWQVYEEH